MFLQNKKVESINYFNKKKLYIAFVGISIQVNLASKISSKIAQIKRVGKI